MHLKNLSIYIILMTLWTGCTKEGPGDPIAYEVILENHLSYSEEEIIPEQHLIFRNGSDWNNFLPEIERANPYQAEHLKNLNFDFNESSLIIIIGEYYHSCCSEITVNGIYKENEDLVVKYKESGPGIATAISQAYTLLKIPK